MTVMPSPYDLQRRNELNKTFSILDSIYNDLPDRYQELFFQPLHSFPFSKLPLELRLMIWRETIPRHRKIWIQPKRTKHSKTTSAVRLSITPSIQACVESRREIYRLMKASQQSFQPISITPFDTIRFDFNLMMRIDSRHEELLALLRRRQTLVSLVRDVEIVVDRFSEMDNLILCLDWNGIFGSFVGLERVKLLVPAGADWIDMCKARFEEMCSFHRVSRMKAGRNHHPLLLLEDV